MTKLLHLHQVSSVESYVSVSVCYRYVHGTYIQIFHLSGIVISGTVALPS